MMHRQYGPNDETQEIPYDPLQRETREIPVRHTDSQKLRAITSAYLPYDGSNKGLNFSLQGGMIVSELEDTAQELAQKELNKLRKAKGESK